MHRNNSNHEADLEISNSPLFAESAVVLGNYRLCLETPTRLVTAEVRFLNAVSQGHGFNS